MKKQSEYLFDLYTLIFTRKKVLFNDNTDIISCNKSNYELKIDIIKELCNIIQNKCSFGKDIIEYIDFRLINILLRCINRNIIKNKLSITNKISIDNIIIKKLKYKLIRIQKKLYIKYHLNIILKRQQKEIERMNKTCATKRRNYMRY